MPSCDAKRSRRRAWPSCPRDEVRCEEGREAARAEPRATRSNRANSKATRAEMGRARIVSPSLRCNRHVPAGWRKEAPGISEARVDQPHLPTSYAANEREADPAATPAGCPPCGDRIVRIILRAGVGIKAPG